MAINSVDEETAKKVVKQVEFYFSDSNLPRDKFLTSTISESEDGMVSLALICSFSRMKTHLGLGDEKPEDISEDTVSAVAETLKTSSSSLKISEDGKKVGRTTELPKPEEFIEQLDVRTVAASPLQYDVKLEDVESFFGQFGKVTSVRLPKHVADKKLFCGSALVEFSTEEDAEKVLKQTPTFAGAELELKPKKDFDTERGKEAELVETTRSQMGADRRNGSNSEPNYPKGVIVAFTLKSVSSDGSVVENRIDDADIVVAETKSEPKESVNVEANDDKSSKNAEETEEKNETNMDENEEKSDEIKEDTESKNAAVMYKDNKDVVLREDLKSIFEKFGKIMFIDFTIGATSGYIRFEEAAAAQKARTAGALDERGGLSVKNFIAMLDPVTGDAEKEYWSFLRNNQEKYRDSKGNTRGGRGGGRNNRGGGRHQNYGKSTRSRENDSSNRANKVQKIGAA